VFGPATLFTLEPEIVAVLVQALASIAKATMGAVSLFIAIGITVLPTRADGLDCE
jgi:hypothetical protein